MFRTMQRLFGVWMRVVITAFAIMVIVVSAAMGAQEMDHRDQSVQIAVASIANTDLAVDNNNAAVPTATCHLGHSCVFVIMPSEDLALSRAIRVREFPRPEQYFPSGSRYPPFHPPRSLSQV